MEAISSTLLFVVRTKAKLGVIYTKGKKDFNKLKFLYIGMYVCSCSAPIFFCHRLNNNMGLLIYCADC